MENVDVVVVGGGQAGLSVSYYLSQQQIDHVVLERDTPFSAWRNRWDQFVTNTPNFLNRLPILGEEVPSGRPGAFATREEILEYLQRSLETLDPPITTAEVTRVSHRPDGSWEVHTRGSGVYKASAVVVCTGAMAKPRYPAEAGAVPESIPQIHSSQYRNPDQIGTGSVLVVGSASSGIQICRILGESKRFDDIHLSVSKVMVLPKRVAGIQTHRFLDAFGVFDVRATSRLGRIMGLSLEGRGDPIMRPAPKDLAKQYGVHLYGRFAGVNEATLLFDDGRTLSSEDLTIVWSTGLGPDYGFLDVKDVLLDSGHPRHSRGVVDATPGLYFVGLRYQHTIASHDLYGVGKDARHVANHISDRLRALQSQAGETAGRKSGEVRYGQ